MPTHGDLAIEMFEADSAGKEGKVLAVRGVGVN
jgi:hypothetical protein